MVFRRQHRCHGRQFRHAVGLKQAYARHALERLAQHGFRHGRRSVAEQTQRGEIAPLELGVPNQPRQHRGHDDRDRDALLLHGVQKRVNVEARQHHVRPGSKRHREQTSATRHVEHRRCVQMHGVCPDVHVDHGRKRIGDQIRVREHHAFRTPGRTARVEKAGQILPAALRILGPG